MAYVVMAYIVLACMCVRQVWPVSIPSSTFLNFFELRSFFSFCSAVLACAHVCTRACQLFIHCPMGACMGR